MAFKNTVTKEVLSSEEFARWVWDEAERKFEESSFDLNWCDLTRDEQISLYCEEFDKKTHDKEWVQEFEEWVLEDR